MTAFPSTHHWMFLWNLLSLHQSMFWASLSSSSLVSSCCTSFQNWAPLKSSSLPQATTELTWKLSMKELVAAARNGGGSTTALKTSPFLSPPGNSELHPKHLKKRPQNSAWKCNPLYASKVYSWCSTNCYCTYLKSQSHLPRCCILASWRSICWSKRSRQRPSLNLQLGSWYPTRAPSSCLLVLSGKLRLLLENPR